MFQFDIPFGRGFPQHQIYEILLNTSKVVVVRKISAMNIKTYFRHNHDCLESVLDTWKAFHTSMTSFDQYNIL